MEIKKGLKSKEAQREDLNEITEYISDNRIIQVLQRNNIQNLHEIQKEAIRKGLFFRRSFLVSAPSGSGKTLIGEISAIHNIFQDFGKSVYLVPFKALATEKYYHFKRNYSNFGINVELSIGDYDVGDEKLEKADLIVTTYEKMDSILRNFQDKDWIYTISTIIIDEIHIIGESSRGPRLESLVVRLNEILHNPQLIGLSATIANPDFFNSWLTSLGNQTVLIKSNKRPVPLNYRIEITKNKDSTIKRIVKSILEDGGQILVFLNKRRSTQSTALLLRDLVKNFLTDDEKTTCRDICAQIESIKGHNRDLITVIQKGLAFHHAGLLPKERKYVEDTFRKRILKVICATTTLSAGINMPSRTVILRDFKRYVISGHRIKNFSGFYENGDGFSYFMPFSANEVFQMLGRAGRPGLDNVGNGVILVSDLDERDWVEDNYFKGSFYMGTPVPKYNDLVSGLNKINILKEQVLLRIYEEKSITLDKLRDYFLKTYFWFGIREKMRDQKIPIDQLLMIKEISPINLLKLHSNLDRIKSIQEKGVSISISQLNKTTISGYVKTDFGVQSCSFDINTGIKCTCGFKNGLSDNYANDEFVFEFCDHVTAFLLHLIQIPDIKLQKYVNDIVPGSVRNQYILNYLFEKGLVLKDKHGKIHCSQFGKLIIRLYLYPVSGVLIRYKLENLTMNTNQDVINEAYDVLKAEMKVRDQKMLQPILEWTDEEPIEDILDRHNIMAGDLFALRDNLERTITFIGVIAVHLSESGTDLQDKMMKVSEISETLAVRIHYGIKEELFDLVLRLENVARVRARVLYDTGYHTASQVKNENPYLLHKKTGLGINLCRNIVN